MIMNCKYSDQIKENEMVEAWEIRDVYKILVGKLQGKGPLERLQCTWILKKHGMDCTDWLRTQTSGRLL
jgi:hypothetical protein